LLHDQTAISPEPASGPGVHDQVPVQRRDVDPAGLEVTLAEGEVDRTADLLVEEDAPGESIDPRVEPHSEFSQPPRAGVELEHGPQVALALLGAGPDDLPVAQLQGDSHEPAAVPTDREAAAQPAGGRVLDRTCEDLAGGHVPPAVRV